jgi:hypothetical protein
VPEALFSLSILIFFEAVHLLYKTRGETKAESTELFRNSQFAKDKADM